jgi:hypothetical protein
MQNKQKNKYDSLMFSKFAPPPKSGQPFLFSPKRALFALFSVFLLSSLLFLLSGCLAEPDYPIIPQIRFENVQNIASKSFQNTDSISITIYFEDGDGDLGLSPADSLPPYTLFNPDGSPNPFYYNYFVEVEKQQPDGSFQNLMFGDQTFTLNGRFPPLNSLGKPTALEGILRFSFQLFPNPITSRGDVLRFRVKIADRALHVSNEVVTDTITVGWYN